MNEYITVRQGKGKKVHFARKSTMSTLCPMNYTRVPPTEVEGPVTCQVCLERAERRE